MSVFSNFPPHSSSSLLLQDMSSYNIASPGCEVWQLEDFHFDFDPDDDDEVEEEDDDSSSTSPEFFIEIFACFTWQEADSLSPRSTLHFHKFKEQCHLLTDSRTSWLVISNMLSQILVPYHLQPLMIQTISTRASEIAGDPENMHLKAIPIQVYLTIGQEQEQILFLDEDLQEQLDQFPDAEDVLRFVHTKKSAILELERVKMEGSGSASHCVICLEELVKGCDAARMPCLHVYHENCIVSWLETSHLCPLCRYEMPVES